MNKYLRWILITAILGFLAQAIWHNWQAVAAVKITTTGWGWLSGAICLSLLAHTIAGCVWAEILQTLGYSVPTNWGARTYLTTNLAKYLPGNVWHFYGRFNACKARSIPSGTSLISILLEPLLMLAAALLIAIGLTPWNNAQTAPLWIQLLAALGLAIVLFSIKPKILNGLLQKVGGAKRQKLAIAPQDIPQIQTYPIKPLLGELLFLGLRGAGFIFTWQSIHNLTPQQLPSLYSGFSLAWLMGLVIPGLPGGIGVFEAVILALLGTHLATGELLVIVGLYRLVNTLAEAIGAGLANVVGANKKPIV
jgi:glycosyltransferase 2 family protein